MPLHDWSTPPANVFHNLHQAWLVFLARALNGSLLPEGYLARTEEYIGPFEADVLTVETGGPSAAPSRPAADEPQPTVTIAAPRTRARRQRRIAVFSERDERRVAVLEIVSPGNKDSQRRASSFRAKILECVEAGLHVVVADVLPATGSVRSFAVEVAAEFGSATPLDDSPRYVTSFESCIDPWEVRVYHHPVQVGRVLPDAPLFLAAGVHVMVGLESTYCEAFGGLPRRDRELLERGRS
jgi:hypothetical protein